MSSTDPPSPPPGAKKKPKPKSRRPPPTRPQGRQRVDAPPIPWEEIERQYVYGVPRTTPEGTPFVHYPPVTELADRFNVTHTTVARRVETRGLEAKRAQFQAETESTIRRKLRQQRGQEFVDRFGRIGETTNLLEQAVAIAVRAFLEPARSPRAGSEGERGDVEVAPPIISSLDAKGYASALKQIAETQKVCAGVLSTFDPEDARKPGDDSDDEEPEMDEDAARAYLQAKMQKNHVPKDDPGEGE